MVPRAKGVWANERFFRALMLALGAAGYGSERRRRGAWAPPEPSWLLSGRRAGLGYLRLNLWSVRRSRSGEAALEPQGVVHREALPVVVEVGEDLGVLAPGADPLAPLLELVL